MNWYNILSTQIEVIKLIFKNKWEKMGKSRCQFSLCCIFVETALTISGKARDQFLPYQFLALVLNSIAKSKIVMGQIIHTEY
jgi:hypothetical protein